MRHKYGAFQPLHYVIGDLTEIGRTLNHLVRDADQFLDTQWNRYARIDERTPLINQISAFRDQNAYFGDVITEIGILVTECLFR